MNYRHAFHAGNHADVFKHSVLALVIEHLKKKEKPFRFVDAHGGIGVYDLGGTEASKTREWEGGIGRMAKSFLPEAEQLLAPYRSAIAALNPGGGFTRYPGSPWIAAELMRAPDRVTANELHPQDKLLLEACFRGDRRVTVTGLDALTAIKASLPPPERRGLVLIDPPYEERDEAQRAIAMLAEGLKRFATGCFILWYPLKADDTAERIRTGAAALKFPGTLDAELQVREPFKDGGLAGSGLVIVNPPWGLDRELNVLLPALGKRLGLGKWGQARLDWLLPPK